MRVKRKIRELVRDESIYPRCSVDSDRVLAMVEALHAGRRFPPVTVDQKNRILDGWTRREAYLMEHGLDWEIDCVVRECRDDAEALKLSAKLNASHGLPLSRSDRVRCLRMASRFGVGAAAMAAVLGTTVSALKAMAQGRVAFAPRSSPRDAEGAPDKGPPSIPAPADRAHEEPLGEVVLSRTVEHLAGSVLTKEQAAANRRLSGVPQLKLVDDLILLLESGSLDQNQRLLERLRRLDELLDIVLASAPVA